MTALRLLALDGPDSRSGFDRRLIDWQQVVSGASDLISVDNERRVLIMLKSICERTNEVASHEESLLTVNIQILKNDSINATHYHMMNYVDSAHKPTAIHASICYPVPETNMEGDTRYQHTHNTRD